MKTAAPPVTEPAVSLDGGALAALSFAEWRVLLDPETWLKHTTPREFLDVSGDDVVSVATQAELDNSFADRLVADSADAESLVACLLDADVRSVAHALSALLSMTDDDAKDLMPELIRNVVGDETVVFDHIGIEVFGRLEWYIELFDRAYSPLGINVVGEHIFPSVQVRRALTYDEELRDVRIGRVFFAHGEHKVNLEVFEAIQSWRFIALRQASLYGHLDAPETRADAVARLEATRCPMLEPVGHVAFRVASASTVEAIQNELVRESAKGDARTMRPYSRQVFYNPADGSTNTKFVTTACLPSGRRIDSQIVEIVSYD